MNHISTSLVIDSDKLNTFCEQLLKRSRNKEKTHDSLVTLETFITRFCAASHGSDEFQQIISIVHRHSNNTRQLLLSQKAEQLVAALRNLDISAITVIYLPLSRNGFYEILQDIASRFSELELSIIAEWSQQWLNYSKHKAQQASDFPDAPDFTKAGISLQEYQAMSDVERFFNSSAIA